MHGTGSVKIRNILPYHIFDKISYGLYMGDLQKMCMEQCHGAICERCQLKLQTAICYHFWLGIWMEQCLLPQNSR